MKNRAIIALALAAIMNLSGFAHGQSESWFDKISKIKPGATTRQDVERIFDSAVVRQVNSFKENDNVYYNTKDGSLRVSYSTGRCPADVDGYDLEKGVVVGLFFSADEPIKVSKLKLDLKQFQSVREDDTLNWIYTNDELGVFYVIFRKKLLHNVAIDFTKTQMQRYSCANKSQSAQTN